MRRARDPDPISAGLASSIFWLGIATERFALGLVSERFGVGGLSRRIHHLCILLPARSEPRDGHPFNTALPRRQQRLRGALCPLPYRAAGVPAAASSTHGGHCAGHFHRPSPRGICAARSRLH